MTSLPIGPRRDAVEKVDRDIEISRGRMDLALDTGDYDRTLQERVWLLFLYEEREHLLACHIHEIEGAVEWFQAQDAGRRLERELG